MKSITSSPKNTPRASACWLQHGAALRVGQALQLKHMAPAQARAQVLAQLQVGRRQRSGSEHAARHSVAAGERMDKPIEGRMLLHRRVKVAVV
jgi:hypothetical protein